jgi:UDP-hydrolysing UDP-N-acetyl-D-glucosamine 2-epimerase
VRALIKISVFTGNRAEYGLLYPLLKALLAKPSIEVSLIISGSHLSTAYGMSLSEIDLSGFINTEKIEMLHADQEWNQRITDEMAFLMSAGGRSLKKLDPDILILAGDRYEAFTIAIASFYMNIPIAHIFGGDLSQGGHLDDSIRHSITKLSHIHFTSNEDSHRRVLALGEEPWRVFNVGSLSIDNMVAGEYARPEELFSEFEINTNMPIVLFTQHPVTTESEDAYSQVKESLEAMKELGYQTIITYPCMDNGSQHIIRAIHEYEDLSNFRIIKSLGWKRYLGFLNIASVVVGNSSSGLMETPYFKVPCVNVGTRQAGRFRSSNVVDVNYNKKEIKDAIIKAVSDKDYIKQINKCENPYGDGSASRKIIEILKTIPIDRKLLQKKMTY